MEFDAADIPISDHMPSVSGQRRSLVEQYYYSLDFTDWNHIRKLLKVYENILNTISEQSPDEAAKLCKWLGKDGFVYQNGAIFPMTGMPALAQIKTIAVQFDAEYMARQVKRIEESVNSDPPLAIGSAKELLETCCRTILADRDVTFADNPDLPKLVRTTMKELELLPEDIPDHAKGAEVIKRLLSNLSTIAQGLTELRNLYGSGHGKEGKWKGLTARHAKLAVGAATTLAVFLLETHRETQTEA
jgi:hypothetical protein